MQHNTLRKRSLISKSTNFTSPRCKQFNVKVINKFVKGDVYTLSAYLIIQS